MQFGLNYGVANSAGKVIPDAVRSILAAARGHRIDTLDTAINYGDSEAVLGSAGVAGFKIISKLPQLPTDCRDVEGWVRTQVNASLARLGIATLEGFLLHRPDDLLGPHGAAMSRALETLVSDGLVRKIGVSIYAPGELDALCAACHIDLVQAPFNVIDRRLASSGWMARLHGMGVEIHTRSTFLQGLLLMARNDIPAKFAPWAALWDGWHDWRREHAYSAVEASLAFVLAFPQVSRVVVGVDSLAQLDGIAAAAGIAPPARFPDLPQPGEVLVNPSLWSGL